MLRTPKKPSRYEVLVELGYQVSPDYSNVSVFGEAGFKLRSVSNGQ